MSTNHLNRDALIIGICQYDDLPMSAQLDTLAKQAEQFAQILETQGGFKVRQLPCTPDLKMSFNDRLAISDTIFPDGRLRQFGLEKAIEELFYPANPSPEHVALLFFAGHGLVKSTKAGTEGFLATSEADGKTVYGISLKWLRDLLRNSPIKQQVVFLESCHSGEFFTHFQTDEKRDYCFVTSARAHEAALAEGLLTKALLDILDYTHQPKDTPWVNSDALIENLQQQLTTAEGWQRFEMQTQGHLMLTNYAFSQQVDPNAKPYKGLHYFDNKPEDALFFKGREKLITELLTKVTEKPFLAILGASGNGKSSVVRAGVLYQLQQTERWQIVNPFTPTADPLTALTNGLGKTEVLTFVQASAKARVLLTIDQFEEVFSLCQESQARETFFNILLDAVEQAAGKLCLIVVMRADFLDKCSNYPRLARYFQDHQHIVTRPTEAEIQQIIEAPAKQAGFLVEPRLVAEMATDFKDSLGGLPLLEFALTTLWEKGKADRLLRYADYQALGGIQGILEKKATDTYKDLTPAEQVVAKRVFLELTVPGEDKSTRRSVPQADLLGFTTTQTPVEQVIAKLVKEHLIVTDKTEVTVVNIAHDALIENWSLLKKWLDQSRGDLKLQRQINEGAKVWKEGKKALLVGVDLARAEEYLGTHLERVPLLEVGVEFVKASMQAQRRQRRWKRAGVASLIVTTVGLAGYTYWYQYSYEWEHVTYCNQFVKRYGLPQCVGELTTSQVQGRAVSYRLLRKGSKNPVYKVQAVRGMDGQLAKQSSSEGLAQISDIAVLTRRHEISTYFGSVSRDDDLPNQGTQESQWEFVVDTGGRIVYEKAFDERNKLVWGLVYSPRLEGQLDRAHYVGAEGFPKPQQGTTAEFVEFEYSSNGYEKNLRYFDRQHQPQLGPNNAFLIQQQVNAQGLVTEQTFSDIHEQSVYKLVSRYDVLGNVTEQAFFGMDGQPLRHEEGFHKWIARYDVLGNEIERAYFGTDGKPVLLEKEGFHKTFTQYDARGNIIEGAIFGTDGKPILNKNGVHKWTAKFDVRGNEIERAFFDIQGQPVFSKDVGYHKVVCRYDGRGYRIEEAYFDTQGQPVFDKKIGYHKLIIGYDEQGNPIETALFDAQKKPMLNKEFGFHKVVMRYDNRGNRIETAFFDIQGQPILNKKIGAHKQVFHYNERGNVFERDYLDVFGNLTKKKDGNDFKLLEEAYFDEAGKPISDENGVHKIVRHFHIDSFGLSEIEETIFDIQGQPTFYKQTGLHKTSTHYDDQFNEIRINSFDIFGNLVFKQDLRSKVNEATYFDEAGKPSVSSDAGVHKLVTRLDERDNIVEGTAFDAQGQPAIIKGGHHKWVSRFDKQNHEIERTFFGTDGQKILLESGYHKWSSQFDAQGNEIERTYFDTEGNPLTMKVIVISVFPDSQGEKLGIQVGDIFTHYDGKPITDMTSFIAGRTAEPTDGPAKELKVLRDGKELTFMVKPGKIGVELQDRVVQKE